MSTGITGGAGRDKRVSGRVGSHQLFDGEIAAAIGAIISHRQLRRLFRVGRQFAGESPAPGPLAAH